MYVYIKIGRYTHTYIYIRTCIYINREGKRCIYIFICDLALMSNAFCIHIASKAKNNIYSCKRSMWRTLQVVNWQLHHAC